MVARPKLVVNQFDPARTLGEAPTLRRLAAEPLFPVLIQRALVMDVAHPKVGRGVEQHSKFRQRLKGIPRGLATLDLGFQMVFGDERIAAAAAARTHKFHDKINGRTDAGTHYTAHDAELQLWVWATIVDWMDTVQTRWIRPLGEAESAALYDDLARWAAFFGIPAELVPADRAAFAAYLDGMLDGSTLDPTDTSRAMIRAVLWPTSVLPRSVSRRLRVLSIGTMDQRLRAAYGLHLDDADQRLFDKLDRRLATSYTKLPAWRVKLPDVYLALRRPTIGLSDKLRRRTA